MSAHLHRGTGMARVGLECSIDLPNSISYCCCCGCGVDNAAEDEDGLNKQLRDGGDGGVKNPADRAIGTTNLRREVGWC
jgi:hypothetical protein